MFRKVIVTLFYFMGWAGLAAQESVEVSALADKNRILIGEPLTLTLEVRVPGNEPLQFFTTDSIPHFEWLEKARPDTLDYEEGVLLRGRYTLTSFVSGRWVIPAFVLPGGQRTDSFMVEVVFSDFDPRRDYHDIRDIREADPDKRKRKDWPYWLGAIILMAVGGYFIFRALTKKPAPAVLYRPPDAYREAREQLKKLREDPAPGREWFSRLTDIFRLYVYRRKGILSLQQTTDDLLRQLEGIIPPSTDTDTLRLTLQLADQVKFARREDSAEERLKALEVISHIIQTLEEAQS